MADDGSDRKVIATNRRARYEYEILDTLEAGVVLQGPEVKSLRAGRASLAESYATDRDGEIYLLNAHIAPYDPASRSGHAPRRPRKLLLRKRELNRLIGAVRREGMTLVPLSLYFNERGLAKVALALARGKKLYDKRASLKERDWAREKGRLLRDKG